MQEFNDRIAVITGGASGLGRAMAERLGQEGMQLMLADVDATALDKTAAALRAAGLTVATQRTDVSRAEDVEALARATLDRYGAVHVVCNNAGVAPLGAVWESTTADWTWGMGVNVWGVIHGVRVFTPILLAQGTDGHIVNTASVAGLISPPGMGVYNVTKHAVVALTESLHHDLTRAKARIRCSVVCPAYFPSGIADSERNRPDELQSAPKTPNQLVMGASMKKAVSSGRLTAADVALQVFRAIEEERFYVITHRAIKAAIEMRMQDILNDRIPTDPMGGR
ncbi:MAG: SDR family NAD(P)-dependent oxidoreductase [Betaproteobacteria bacterium]|nr:SDR family NAD(P)-dependent oxidoreductase [Betaproteobacteria bacterium]